MATALVAAAAQEGAPPLTTVTEYETLKGEGVSAVVAINGKSVSVQVGNNRLATKHGWQLKLDQAVASKRGSSRTSKEGNVRRAMQLSSEMEAWERDGGTVGWVAVSGLPVALFSVSDIPRREAASVIPALHKRGVKTVMLTGDNEGAAMGVARTVGLSGSKLGVVHAGLLPEDKIQHVEAIKRELTDRRCVYVAFCIYRPPVCICSFLYMYVKLCM
jgi:Cu+-exporting ATPase